MRPGSWHYHGGAGPTRRPALLTWEKWQGSSDLYCNGRSVPPAYPDCTVCPGQELPSCELLAFPAPVIEKYTHPSVITDITNGRKGLALLVNSSLVEAYMSDGGHRETDRYTVEFTELRVVRHFI